MKKVINLFNLIFLFLMSTQVMAAKEEGEKVNSDVFSIINLDYPGLESVKAEYQKGNEKKAAELLLHYYRTRTGIHNPDVDLKKISVSARQRKLSMFTTVTSLPIIMVRTSTGSTGQ